MNSILFYLKKATSIIRKRVWVLVMIGIGVVVLVIFNYTVLIIDLGKPYDNLYLKAYASQELLGSTTGKTLRAGINIMQTGSYTIEASSKQRVATKGLSLNPLSIKRVEMNLKNQKSVDSLVSNNSKVSCVFTNNNVTYICKQGTIFKYSLHDQSENPVTSDLTLLGNQVLYKNGILSLVLDSSGRQEQGRVVLAFITGSSPVQVIDDSRQRLGLSSIGKQLAVNTTDEDTFLLQDQGSSKVYIYKNTVDKQPIEYSYGDDVTGDPDVAVVSFSGNSFFINSSIELEESSNAQRSEDNPHPNYSSEIIKYSYDDSRAVTKNETYNISSITDSSNTDGETYAITDTLLLSIDISGTAFLIDIAGKPTISAIIPSFGQFVTKDGRIIYTQSNRIFEREANNGISYLIRESSHMSFGSPKIIDGKIIFSGVSRHQNSTPSYYQVLPINRKEIEPFDVFPYNPEEMPVSRSRFYSNNLFFTVKVDTLRYPKYGRVTYNKREFEIKQNIIKRRLRTEGFDLNKYNIRFDLF